MSESNAQAVIADEAHFRSDDEARAWDMYVCAFLETGDWGTIESGVQADRLIGERRLRCALKPGSAK